MGIHWHWLWRLGPSPLGQEPRWGCHLSPVWFWWADRWGSDRWAGFGFKWRSGGGGGACSTDASVTVVAGATVRNKPSIAATNSVIIHPSGQLHPVGYRSTTQGLLDSDDSCDIWHWDWWNSLPTKTHEQNHSCNKWSFKSKHRQNKEYNFHPTSGGPGRWCKRPPSAKAMSSIGDKCSNIGSWQTTMRQVTT